MSELKPCPFCGKQPELEVSELDLNGSAVKDVFQYYCDDCGVYTPEFDDIEDAAKQWSTRAPQSEWISVDDRLPAFGRWYLIKSDCESIEETPIVTMAFLDTQVVGDNVAAPIWLTHNDNYRMDSGNGEWENVTHWMPLPEPPK